MQSEFDFHTIGQVPDGLTAWHRERQERLAAIAQANGLPLGHPCRVELAGGVVLEGVLRIAEDELCLSHPTRDLKLKLQIDRCQFFPREILSVVRLD